MAFPLKTDLDVEEMLSVAQQEQDSSSIGTINYQKLLMEVYTPPRVTAMHYHVHSF